MYTELTIQGGFHCSSCILHDSIHSYHRSLPACCIGRHSTTSVTRTLERQSRAKKQAALIQRFRKKHLIWLRDFYPASAPNAQTMKPGDVIVTST